VKTTQIYASKDHRRTAIDLLALSSREPRRICLAGRGAATGLCIGKEYTAKVAVLDFETAAPQEPGAIADVRRPRSTRTADGPFW